LALDDLGPGADQKEVASLKHALERMQDVINYYTKKNGEIFQSQSTAFALAASDAQVLYHPLFEKKNVHLQLELTAELGLPFDRITSLQIIGNLLTNALEASKEGDKVLLQFNENGFDVHDQGSGFSLEALKRAHEPGFTT